MTPRRSERPIRVLRMVARLNVGGSSHPVSILSGRLDPARFETLLVTGHLGPGEGSLEDLAEHHGARLEHVPALGPELDPVSDALALRALVVIMRRFRPDIVHTHTAKAGTLGRVAARLAFAHRPVIVHTYHGHVLSKYFGRRKEAAFRQIERELARMSDCLIGVCQATVDDLVEMRVAPRERFRVVRDGLDLEPYLALGIDRDPSFGAAIGAPPDDLLALYVGRLAPIKRVDVLIAAMAHARARGARVHLVIVGDGELRKDLEEQARRLELTAAVTFLGFRRDLPQIIGGADLAVLSSDNEATPMSLIEAAAGARPAVATDVGGVSDVVDADMLAPAGDSRALGALLARADKERAELPRRGMARREGVRDVYTPAQLIANTQAVYDELLARRASSRVGGGR